MLLLQITFPGALFCESRLKTRKSPELRVEKIILKRDEILVTNEILQRVHWRLTGFAAERETLHLLKASTLFNKTLKALKISTITNILKLYG